MTQDEGNTSHLSPDDFERIVRGGSPPREDWEGHLDRCPACEARADQVGEEIGTRLISDAAKVVGKGIRRTLRHRPVAQSYRMHPSGVHRLLALLAFLLPGLINNSVSFHYAGRAGVATLDYWRLLQSDLVRFGLGIAAAVVLLAACWALVRPLKAVSRVLLVMLVGLLLLSGGFYVFAGYRHDQRSREIAATFYRHRWCCYDSPSHDPENHPDPTPAEMARELGVLHDQGHFDGLITFDLPPEVAAAAAAAKFKAVILGIPVPLGNPEAAEPAIRRAIAFERASPAAASLITAYCVGQNPPSSLPLERLGQWIEELRAATGKPVTSTFTLTSYLSARGSKIREIGDFYFPDVAAGHLPTSPENARVELRHVLEQVMQLAGEKPVMLKMVGFPGFPPGRKPPEGHAQTEEDQLEFYRDITRNLYLPPGVHLSCFNGFDIPWKRNDAHKGEFDEEEEYVGLFRDDKDLTPKPAVEAVSSDRWPIQSKP